MIQSSNYGAVIEIVDFGMIGILRLFFDTLNSIDENTSGVSINYINTTTTITNDLALSMIIASENAPFIVACREGHLEISQQIFRWMEGFSNNSTHVENLKQTAISQHNYLAFRKASQRNQLHVVKQLFKWASPTHRRNMIASGDFLGYNWAISSGFTAMAKLHVRHASSTQRDEMLGNQTRRL